MDYLIRLEWPDDYFVADRLVGNSLAGVQGRLRLNPLLEVDRSKLPKFDRAFQ